MVSYCFGVNNSMVWLSFGEGWVFWCDLLSLLLDSVVVGLKWVVVFDWVFNLCSIGVDVLFSMLLVVGLVSDQVKLLCWCFEIVVLFVVLFDLEGCVNELCCCIWELEDLYGELCKIVVVMFVEVLFDFVSKDIWVRVCMLFDNGLVVVIYFVLLECLLFLFMVFIGGDSLEMLDEVEVFW